MCACTEPVRTGVGAVCVEHRRSKWPISMLNHQDIPGTEKCFYFYFWRPTYARTTRYEEAFLPKGKKRPRSLRSLGLASLLISILIVVTQLRGHIAGSFFPLSTSVRALAFFYHQKTSALFSLVDSRRVVPAHAISRRSVHSSAVYPYKILKYIKISPRHIRTPGPQHRQLYLVAFEVNHSLYSSVVSRVLITMLS